MVDQDEKGPCHGKRTHDRAGGYYFRPHSAMPCWTNLRSVPALQHPGAPERFTE